MRIPQIAAALLIQSLLVPCLLVGSAGAEERIHHTFRYLTTSGYPQVYRTMVFSPDEERLAVSVANSVRFIRTKLGTESGQKKISPFSMAFTKRGNRIYMISSYQSYLLDMLTGHQIKVQYKEQPGFVGLGLVQRNGKLLVDSIHAGGPLAKLKGIRVGDELIGVGEGQGGSVRDVQGRTVDNVLKSMQGPAGTYLRLRVLPKNQFDPQNARLHVVRRMPGTMAGGEIEFFEFSPPTLTENLAWCMSNSRHAFRNAHTGQPVAFLQTIDVQNVGLYAISPDQKRFAVVASKRDDGSHNAVEVFDIASQDRVAHVPIAKDSYYDIAFAHDNNRVLVATWDSIEVIDANKSQTVNRLRLGWNPKPKAKEKENRGGIGLAVINAARDNLGFGAPPADRSPRKLVSKIAVSPNQIVATADDNGRVSIWDLNSGDLLHTLPQNPQADVRDIVFSPRGKWLAYHIKGVLHLVDVASIKGKQPSSSAAAGDLAKSQNQVEGEHQKETASEANDEPQFMLQVGVQVEVHSRGDWFAAKIVEDLGGGLWRIRYESAPNSWDERVTSTRLRPRKAKSVD